MGKETNFDPDILEHAHTELQQLNNLITHSAALKRLTEASSIQGDLTVQGLSDSNGGWGWLEQHVQSIAGGVGQIVQDIQTESTNLQQRMRTSIDQLKGADDDNKSGFNKSRQNIESGNGKAGK